MRIAKEKGLPDANQHSPKKKDTSFNHSITQPQSEIKRNLLREIRVSKKIPAKDMVRHVRKRYPKYDKMLQSKCEHGDEYGISIRPDAMDSLLNEYAPELLAKEKHRRGGYHRLKCRLSCRVEDEDHDAFVKGIAEDGFSGINDGLLHLVKGYIQTKSGKEHANGI